MADARTLTGALGGRWYGSYGTARCPAHADRNPSLAIGEGESGRVLVRCHAGCDQKRLIATLKTRGLWAEISPRLTHPAPGVNTERQPDRNDAKGTEAALAIWQSSIPADGTLVEAYLAARGLNIPPPPTLHYHAGLRHWSGGIWPVMVALVTSATDGTRLGIHRTFLARNGAGKAPLDPAKMMLGPCRGGAVRLSASDDVLMVGEGIETCLAAMQATGKSAWAALSTSGLRALALPRAVRQVIILADGDDAGEAAARDCAYRWTREGRRVRIARPPSGLDFNDMLVGGVPSVEGAL